MSTEQQATQAAIDRLIRMFGAVLLSEEVPDRGYPLRELIEPEGPIDVIDVDVDWSRWGSQLRQTG